jgi:hypothetical protein
LLFDETISQWSNDGNFFYDPQLKYKEIFVLPRVNYMVEVLRQLAMTHKRVVAVVDTDLLPFIEDGWMKMGRDVRPLKELLKVSKYWTGGSSNKLTGI